MRVHRGVSLLATGLLFATVALSAQELETEPNDTRSRASDLACGASGSGAIDRAGDVDLYRLTLAEPRAVSLDVDGFQLSNARDLVLVLEDADGNVLASNDDGAAPGERNGSDPYLAPLPLAAGTYYFGVAGYPDLDLSGTSTETGTYSLAVGCTATYGCSADAHTLCIDDEPGDRRFEIRVAYDTTQSGGRRGDAEAMALSQVGITQGGVFSFFDVRNPEILVKVLDGCAANGKIWVFYSATTNVGFTMTVRDLASGDERTYVNADRHAATPLLDTAAFATCPTP